MNELNYATLPACQRLQAAGIVLETDCFWTLFFPGEWRLDSVNYGKDSIPAPSMAEVWRDLPEGADLSKGKELTYGLICRGRHLAGCESKNINPTDTLIYLRIWLEEKKEKP